MSTNKCVAIVPAAGLGTRMKSQKPKFLHSLCGQTIIAHIVNALVDIVDEIVVVVGNGKELVKAEIEESCSKDLSIITFVTQEELLGSGHAVKTAMNAVSKDVADVMVVLGDMPLLNSQVIKEMHDTFLNDNADVLVSTAINENPFGYGRVIRDDNGNIEKIVEEKDCNDQQKNIKECNMYPFIFSNTFIEKALDKLTTDNAQGEQYLTDVVGIARDQGNLITSYTYEDPMLSQGVNDREQLSILEKFMRDSINSTHMKNGVTMIDPNTTYIDKAVVIESDVTILPGTILQGNTTIKQGSVVGPNTRIIDSIIGSNCVIETSTIKSCTIHNDVTVGPYVSLRPETVLHDGVHVGTFVEIKKSEIGKDSKVPHLSYLGDTTVGEKTNLGAGTITANYDGKNKHQTAIGSGVKTGVHTVLVAPITIGDGVYSAAGSVVIRDVPDDVLVKGVPAEVVDGWVAPNKR